MNTDGAKGPICNYCGGYGFTNVATGGSAGCQRCLGSGVDERLVLERRLTRLEWAVERLLERQETVR